MKKKFEVIEEDGIVIYDESDDYDPGEAEETPDDNTAAGGFRLMTNEEIFTDEYMQEFARKMDDQIAKEKRDDLLISISVILAVILFIGFVTFINFKDLV